ncbi:SH3 domain-containing protein [Caulobacter sp. 17J80-11]|uniref:SH3 domain-containing protein n=1 Tax=Caulobacter sp. 17J80-11 TaxID=2763502 RepID=UPI00351C9861
MKRSVKPKAVAALVLTLGVLAGSVQARPADKPTPSGLPVPRWVSLKFGEVNARSGPGDDYKLVWVYRSKGLPLQVVAETAEWRKVCDPDGGSAWVHRRTVDGRRTAFQPSAKPLALRAKPKYEAATRAYMSPRSIAALEECENGWCKLKAGDVKAWAPAQALWGAQDAAHCR